MDSLDEYVTPPGRSRKIQFVDRSIERRA
jgi:hypothetical protein